MADPTPSDIAGILATLAKGVQSQARASGRVREAVGDLAEQVESLDRRLSEHSGQSAARHDETLRRLGELTASPLQRAAEQHAVEVIEGRAGVSGWLRTTPERLAALARWVVAHPVQAVLLLSGAAAVARVIAARVPALAPVAEILEAMLTAAAPIEPQEATDVPP